jgi:hypothetical protein
MGKKYYVITAIDPTDSYGIEEADEKALIGAVITPLNGDRVDGFTFSGQCTLVTSKVNKSFKGQTPKYVKNVLFYKVYILPCQ